MSFEKYKMAGAVALFLSAGSVMAATGDTGTITFHGLVSNNTCKVSLDQKIDQSGNDFDVNLDTVFVKDFTAATQGAASTLGQKKFTLSLTECTTASTTASAQFKSWAGTTATSGGMLVPPSNAQGAAKNVNLVLSNDGNSDTSQVVVDQTNNTQKATITNNAANLYYRVAYTQGQGWDATTNPVTAGTVQAQVAFTMIYE
ncbi:fimbrial protein [Enterobacter pseudoroggenkampii]|uniref:fimbrial protein n=1 Tax=Enterobacter pseudoroggenkampii TaxID=2996112 RepID=UPI0004630DD6|nr:fimbrial protein [Enterobacter pseudoroggenkampii]MCK4230486.1 fimbrial protein [Enterobacter asburiae]MCX8290014.1 fimbrial protein [Enterobacter pseudoroggenkampii]